MSFFMFLGMDRMDHSQNIPDEIVTEIKEMISNDY